MLSITGKCVCAAVLQSLDHQKAPSPFLQYCVWAHDQDDYINFLCVNRFIECVFTVFMGSIMPVRRTCLYSHPCHM